jgi:hypothetical protein
MFQHSQKKKTLHEARTRAYNPIFNTLYRYKPTPTPPSTQT